MRPVRVLAAVVALSVASAPASAATLKPKPIPAAAAFTLPSAKQCVRGRALTLHVHTVPGVKWTGATVTVNSKRVKDLTRAQVKRSVKLTDLPLATFALSITARAGDGRHATARRTYYTCAPKVTIPAGDPPKQLVITDLKAGTGPAAAARQDATVQYVGVAWSTRKQFDSSWERASPFTFTLDSGQVIDGFDQGITGMKVGGRRRVIIPPGLGYGAEGSGPIGPNETLIFVIDLVALS
jgi:peptidylprolyl isomerase